MATKHMPWDHGVIDEAMRATFGVGSLHKTVKTICGKRVPTQQAGTVDVDCPACCAKLREELQGVELVAADAQKRGKSDDRLTQAVTDFRSRVERACAVRAA